MIKEISYSSHDSDDGYIEFCISYTNGSGSETQRIIQKWCINNIEKQCSVYGDYGDIYVLFHNNEKGAEFFKETMKYFSWLRLMGLHETYDAKLL